MACRLDNAGFELVCAQAYNCIEIGIRLVGAMGQRNDLINAMRKGAPLTYWAPEPILLSPTILMMTRFPPHPYGAMLLYDYIISVEGVSQLTRDIPVLPSREGLPLADDIRALQKRPSYFIQVEDQSRSFTETSEMYHSLIEG
jgi:hypothetical protein